MTLNQCSHVRKRKNDMGFELTVRRLWDRTTKPSGAVDSDLVLARGGCILALQIYSIARVQERGLLSA